MGLKRKLQSAVSVEEVLGTPIRFQDVIKLYMVDRNKGRAVTTSVHYPGCLTVCVGSFVALFPQNERREWYLYVTAVSDEEETAVTGYFAYTDYTIRKETNCKDFKSDFLFLTHEKFTTALSTVRRTVHVLPGCFFGNSFPEGTLYYDSFFDVGAGRIRKINFQLKHPGHLFQFLASNSVLGSGGGERNLVLFKRGFRTGLENWCERWRDMSISPKRGVNVSMLVDLEELLCLPFTLLQSASVDTKQGNFIFMVSSENELSNILGKGWTSLQKKARKVKDGELIQYEFHLPAKVVYSWSTDVTMVNFHGATCRNGAGVLQWSTLVQAGG